MGFSWFLEDLSIGRRIANACDTAENGEFIIALDSQDRENEGDLIIAAESVTDAQMAFLVRFTR